MKKLVLSVSLALSMFSFGQNRVTMIETFTSSTCPPCNPGNVNLQNLLADPTNDGKQVSLKYQMYWPGNGDPYFTDEGDVRRGVYSVSSIPETRLDGGNGFNTGSLTQGDLNSAYAVAAKASIDAFYTINEAAQTVDVSVTVTPTVNTPPGVRLYVAIFEYETNNNVESNGETAFYHVMKKMLPDASGTVLSPMTIGQTYEYTDSYTFNGNYFLPADATDPIDHAIENSVEQFSDLGVAVWMQQLSTREVYQAGYAQLSSAGLEETDSPVASAKIYPNPASNSAKIAVQLAESQDVLLEVVDMTGKVVRSNELGTVEAGRSVHNFDVDGLENGIYTVRLITEGSMYSKRLAIQN